MVHQVPLAVVLKKSVNNQDQVQDPPLVQPQAHPKLQVHHLVLHQVHHLQVKDKVDNHKEVDRKR